MKKYVIGTTNLAVEAMRQYVDMGSNVEVFAEDLLPKTLEHCGELFVAMTQGDTDTFMADSANFNRILPLLTTYNPENNGGRKLLCHLMLYSQNCCDLFHSNNLVGALNDKIEVWPFTLEDIVAQKIVFDRMPVTMESDLTVHLVLFGFSRWAEAVAKNAALVCHYPNYIRNHSLRTRITIIDEKMYEKHESFVTRYRYLLENSYVRFVNVDEASSTISCPQFAKSREDFVDIEWEFVQSSPGSIALLTKIETWLSDDSQQLTMVVCYDDYERNLLQADRISDCLVSAGKCSLGLPVYVSVRDASLFRALHFSDNIKPLFYDLAAYDVSLPLRRMAQIVNYVYAEVYDSPTDDVRVPSEIDFSSAEECWEKENDAALRWSSVCNAMAIRSKMHSLGHNTSDWRIFYSINAREVKALAEVEHNRWSVEKLMNGFRPLTDKELKTVADNPDMKKVLKSHKAHTDLRSYSDLQRDETGKNVQEYDICLSQAIPLIASISVKE